MFVVGDKIVYPIHGAGIIERIEKKVILGETNEYYILRVPCGDLQVMIPVDASDEIGIRPISSPELLKNALNLLSEQSTAMSDNWNHRYRENMEKLKSGDLLEIAEVMRNLTRVDRVKKLSTGEKKMLTNAKQIFISEMILISDISHDEAEHMLLETI